MGRDARESAAELRCVAPMVVVHAGKEPRFVGPCMLVTNGTHALAVASSEMLRQAGEPLAILTRLDGKQSLPVPAWSMARQPGLGIIDLGQASQFSPEVHPLHLGAVCATVDTRGAPSGLVVIVRDKSMYVRRVIPVYVDNVDGGGMSDDIITRLASPIEARDKDADVESSALFSWMPADPVLGRKSEVVAVALGLTYRAKTFKPRALPALAELVGLEDLGRALPWAEHTPPPQNELGQIAGEIRDDETGPIAGLDLDREE